MNSLDANSLPFNFTNINDPSILPYMKEINETPEIRVKCLGILRKELQSLEDLDPCLDEKFLLKFLRVSKFNTSKAFQRVIKFYQQQEVLVDALKNVSMSLEKAGSLNYVWASPNRLKNNSVLQILFSGQVDYRKFNFAERFYMDILALYSELDNPVNQMTGFTLIFDYKGFNFKSFLEHSPRWTMLFSETFVNAAPARFKGFHIVNAPSLFLTVYKLLYPFFPKKTRERLHMHPNDGWKSLHAVIPPEILPEEYGGKQKLSSFVNIMKHVEQLDDGFHKILKHGYVKSRAKRESFRPICRKS